MKPDGEFGELLKLFGDAGEARGEHGGDPIVRRRPALLCVGEGDPPASRLPKELGNEPTGSKFFCLITGDGYIAPPPTSLFTEDSSRECPRWRSPPLVLLLMELLFLRCC